jgi:hypothetical protein
MSQLLPDKFVPVGQTVIGQGATLLAILSDRAVPVAQLFVEARERTPYLTYDGFGLTLASLYALGLIEPVGNALIGRASA